MDIKHALKSLAQHTHLGQSETELILIDMLAGRSCPAQVTAFFMALKMKGETFDEILGASIAVQHFMKSRPLTPGFVSVSHTGNELLGALDLSIASAFAAAAAGCRLVVHDGRLNLSRTVSGAFLEAAGIKTTLPLEQVVSSVNQLGIGFTFGFTGNSLPIAHFEVAEHIGIPTLLSVLNLVANPFQSTRHLIGVHDADLCPVIAELFLKLGSERVMVVHGADGLDAISLATETRVAELKDGEITEYSISPDDFGVQAKSLIGLLQDSVEESLLLVKDALGNRRGHYAEKAADIIILNAGAAVYVSGVAESLRQGVSMAREVVANTLAGEKIRQTALFSQQFKK
jgi:anthranilate phosphoribosyltransferase